MKKNTIMRIAAVVLMCTLVTACFASSTFARYTSGATSNEDTLTVAKWSFVVGGTDITKSNTFTFDLFGTINHHANSDNVTKIAPGTCGEFKLNDIKNDSEVDATVTVKVASVKNADGIPIKFYKDENFTDEIEDVKAGKVLINEEVVRTGATLDATTIYWAWDIDSNGSANDTELGIKAQSANTVPTYTIALEVTATQMDEG